MTLSALNGRRPRLEAPDARIAPSSKVVGEAILSVGVSNWFSVSPTIQKKCIDLVNPEELRAAARLYVWKDAIMRRHSTRSTGRIDRFSNPISEF